MCIITSSETACHCEESAERATRQSSYVDRHVRPTGLAMTANYSTKTTMNRIRMRP